MRELFIEHRFNTSKMATIDTINSILEEYQQQNFRLSLRQLYYQLVARDYIPNSVKSYKTIGTIVSDARNASLIDWGMIEDRGRETVIPNHWANPAEIVEDAAEWFHTDRWADQPYHIEVMVEKDALSGVLEPTCRSLDIGLTANKGYSSSSTMYEVGKRLYQAHQAGKKISVLYLGDHDPSGIDMTRDVEERLTLYSSNEFERTVVSLPPMFGFKAQLPSCLEVVRLALNLDQVQLWKPPENVAKNTDKRYRSYVEQFGTSSWELDAVEPKQLAQLVIDAVGQRCDIAKWKAAVIKERDMKSELREFVNEYNQDQQEDGISSNPDLDKTEGD